MTEALIAASSSALIPKNVLLTPAEAAEFLNVSRGSLDVWRCIAANPKKYKNSRVPKIPFIKIGGAIRYRLVDLERFLVQNTFDPERLGKR